MEGENAEDLARSIVNNPTRQSSQRRYTPAERRYEEMLIQGGCVDITGSVFQVSEGRSDPVSIACSLILQRCGPADKGFEEKKARSTGGAIKSAVVNYWRKKGITGDYFENADGSFSGNPGKCPKLQSLINYLDDAQRAARKNLTNRAYQETHEDVRKLYYTYIKPCLSRAIRKDTTVNMAKLQASIVNLLQFNSVARGNEILNLQVKDLVFTGDSMNSPIVAILPVTKNKKKSYTYFKFSKQVDISICGLSALQGWLCVIRSFGMDEGNLFLQVSGNELQGGTELDSSTYARLLRQIGSECGINGLAEHSARRGGAGYHYFVLRRDLFFIYRTFSWESIGEMMKYIGIEDVYNSYALLGFTAFGTNELFFPTS